MQYYWQGVLGAIVCIDGLSGKYLTFLYGVGYDNDGKLVQAMGLPLLCHRELYQGAFYPK